MSALTCDTCPETADGVKPAIAHVTANPAHKMTGPAAVEGATVTISIVDPEDEDDGFYDDDGFDAGEDDWADQ